MNTPSPNSSEWQGNSEMGSKSFVIMISVSSPDRKQKNRYSPDLHVQCMANLELHNTQFTHSKEYIAIVFLWERHDLTPSQIYVRLFFNNWPSVSLLLVYIHTYFI